MQKNRKLNSVILKVGIILILLAAFVGVGLFNVNRAYADSSEVSIEETLLGADTESQGAESYSASDLIVDADAMTIEAEPFEGDGSEDYPYKIYTPGHLANMANQINGGTTDKHYKLAANISLAGKIWIPAGYNTKHAFTGSFDGDGFTISGLYVDNASLSLNGTVGYGLFGVLGQGATIKNVQVIGANIVAGSGYAGIIAGRASGTSVKIEACYVTGTISTGDGSRYNYLYRGGIIGYGSGASISRCYTNVTFVNSSSSNYIYTGSVSGGYGTVTDCLVDSSSSLIGSNGSTTNSARRSGTSYTYYNNLGNTTTSSSYRNTLLARTTYTPVTPYDVDGTRTKTPIWHVEGSVLYLNGVGNVYVDSESYIATQDYSSAINELNNLPYNNEYNVNGSHSGFAKGIVATSSSSSTQYSGFYELGEAIATAYIKPNSNINVWVGYQITNLNSGSLVKSSFNSAQNVSSNVTLYADNITEETTSTSNSNTLTSDSRQGYFVIDTVFDNILYEFTVTAYDASPNNAYYNSIYMYKQNFQYVPAYYSSLGITVNTTNIDLDILTETNTSSISYSRRTAYCTNNYAYSSTSSVDSYSENLVMLRYGDTKPKIQIKNSTTPYLAEFKIEKNNQTYQIYNLSYENSSYLLSVNNSQTQNSIIDANAKNINIKLYFTNATKVTFNKGTALAENNINLYNAKDNSGDPYWNSYYSYWVINTATSNSRIYRLTTENLSQGGTYSNTSNNDPYAETKFSYYTFIGWSSLEDIEIYMALEGENVAKAKDPAAVNDERRPFENYTIGGNTYPGHTYSRLKYDVIYGACKLVKGWSGTNTAFGNFKGTTITDGTNHRVLDLYSTFKVPNYGEDGNERFRVSFEETNANGELKVDGITTTLLKVPEPNYTDPNTNEQIGGPKYYINILDPFDDEKVIVSNITFSRGEDGYFYPNSPIPLGYRVQFVLNYDYGEKSRFSNKYEYFFSGHRDLDNLKYGFANDEEVIIETPVLDTTTYWLRYILKPTPTEFEIEVAGLEGENITISNASDILKGLTFEVEAHGEAFDMPEPKNGTYGGYSYLYSGILYNDIVTITFHDVFDTNDDLYGYHIEDVTIVDNNKGETITQDDEDELKYITSQIQSSTKVLVTLARNRTVINFELNEANGYDSYLSTEGYSPYSFYVNGNKCETSTNIIIKTGDNLTFEYIYDIYKAFYLQSINVNNSVNSTILSSLNRDGMSQGDSLTSGDEISILDIIVPEHDDSFRLNDDDELVLSTEPINPIEVNLTYDIQKFTIYFEADDATNNTSSVNSAYWYFSIVITRTITEAATGSEEITDRVNPSLTGVPYEIQFGDTIAVIAHIENSAAVYERKGAGMYTSVRTGMSQMATVYQKDYLDYSDVTVYGLLDLYKYNVNFHRYPTTFEDGTPLNYPATWTDGSNLEIKTVSVWYNHTMAAGSFPKIEREGYTSSGLWSTEKDSTTSNFGASTRITSEYDVYPVWEEICFIIDYNENLTDPCYDGIDVVDNRWLDSKVEHICSGDEFTFPTLESDSHNFMGWRYTFNGTEYTASAGEIINWDFATSMTFTAIWETKEYDVQVVIVEAQSPDGINIDYSTQTNGTKTKIKYGLLPSTAVNLDVNKPSEQGYMFIGYMLEAPNASNISSLQASLPEVTVDDDNTEGRVFTVYVVYKNYYTLTYFSAGHGEISIDGYTSPFYATYGEEYQFILTPDPGYIFRYYIVDPAIYAGNISSNNILTMPASDLTVEAVFDVAILVLTYKADHDGSTGATFSDGTTEKTGSVTYLDNNYTYGSNTGMPTPSRTGFDFGGWTTDINWEDIPEDERKIYTSNTIWDIPASTTLYATWEPESYDLEFVLSTSGVTNPSALESISVVPLGETEAETRLPISTNIYQIRYGEVLTLPTLTSDSHDLIGWYLNTNTQTVYDAGDTLEWEQTTGGTLTAVWSAKTFTVNVEIYGEHLAQNRTSYNYVDIGNGNTYPNLPFGTFSSSTFGVDASGAPSLAINKPTSSNYTFVGYALSIPTGDNISSTFPTINLLDSSDYVNSRTVTLYLVYKNHYTLSFQASSTVGSLTVSVGSVVYRTNVEVTCGENVTLNPVATTPGYHFDSYTSVPNVAISDGVFSMPASNVDITANFEPDVISLNYYMNDGTDTLLTTGRVTFNSADYVYGASSTQGMPTPVREGYTFAGWYDDDTSGNIYTSTTTWNKAENLANLYAHWNVLQFGITVNIYGEVASSDNKTNLSNYELSNVARISVSDGDSTVYNENATLNVDFDFGKTITINGVANDGYELYTARVGNTNQTLPYEFVLGSNGATVNVYYSRIDYTLRIDTNAGSDQVTGLTSTSYTLNYGQVLTLPTLTRRGYTHLGYATESTATQEEFTTSYTQGLQAQTLYAVWSANPYSISVSFRFENLNGEYVELNELRQFNISYLDYFAESLSSFNGEIAYRTQVTISNIVVENGFEVSSVQFNNVTLNSAGGNYTFSVPVDGGSVIIYVDRIEYNVTLDLDINNATDDDFGDWHFTDDIATRGILFEQEVELPDLTNYRSGYDFLGWGNDGEVIYKVGDTYTQGTSAVSLQAIWGPKSYQITYNFNKTDPCGDEKNVVNAAWAEEEGVTRIYSGDSFTFMPLTSESHNFLGWQLTYNGRTYTYEPNSSISWNLVSDEPFEFVAMWETKQFNVTVEAWHANITTEDRETVNYSKASNLTNYNQTVYYGDTVTGIIDGIYSQTGYTFVGYYTNSSFDGSYEISIDTPITQNTTIYLLYKNYYELLFSSSDSSRGALRAQAAGSDLTSGDYVTYGETVTLIPEPNILSGHTESGYIFDSYSITPNARITNNTFSMPVGVNDKVSVMVKFKPKTITITYNANGGIFSYEQTTKTGTVTYLGTDYTFKEIPTYVGHDFIEWNTEIDGTGNSYASTDVQWIETSTTDTLYAIWDETPYKITVEVRSESTTEDNRYTASQDASFRVEYVNNEDDQTIQTEVVRTFEEEVPFGSTVRVFEISIDAGFRLARAAFNDQELKRIDNSYYEFKVPNSAGTLAIYLNRRPYNVMLDANTTDSISNVAGWNFTQSGNTQTATNTYKYGAGVVLPTPVRLGYNFLGWEGNETYPGGSTYKVSSSNVKLTASWEIKSFPITVNIAAAEGTNLNFGEIGFSLMSGDTEILKKDPKPNDTGTTFTTDISYAFNTELTLNVTNGTYKIFSITGIEGLQPVKSQTFKVVDSGDVANIITITFSAITNYSIVLKANGAESWNAASDTLEGWVLSDYNQTATHELSIGETINLITPSKTGYNFKGWATRDGATVSDYEGNTYTPTSAENQIFYLHAVWEVIPYDVTIYYQSENTSEEFALSGKDFTVLINGVADTINGDTITGSYDYGTTFEFASNGLIIPEGFKFKDIVIRNASEDTSETITNLPYVFTVPNYEVEIIIRIERQVFDVNLNPNAGTDAVEGLPEQFTAKYDISVTLPTPTRSGYNFDGWTLAQTSTAYVTRHTQGLIEVTYYAQWTRTEFELTVNLFINGVQSTEDWTLGYDSTLCTPTFQDGVYTFQILYNTYLTFTIDSMAYRLDRVEVGDDVVYTNLVDFTMPAESSEINIYLVNEDYTFTLDASNYINRSVEVTFPGADASWNVANSKATKDIVSYDVVNLLEPASVGYEFQGWYTEPYGEGTPISETTFTQNVPEDVTYYARWGLASSALTYTTYLENANDDEFVQMVSGDENFDKVFAVAPVFSHNGDIPFGTLVTVNFTLNEGFTMLSNNVTGGNSGTLISNGNSYSYTFYMLATTTGIRFNVTRQLYTLTFNDGLGTSVGTVTNLPNPVSLKFEQSYTLPVNVSRSGFTFSGWFTELNGQGTQYDNTNNLYFQANADETLFAYWTINDSGLIVRKYLDGELTTGAGTFTIAGETAEPNEAYEYEFNFEVGRYLSLSIDPGVYNLQDVQATGTSLSGTGNTRRFTMTEEGIVISIYFTSRDYTLTLVGDNYLDSNAVVSFASSTGWTVDGSTATYSIRSNASVTLISPESTGYNFLDWYSLPEGQGELVYEAAEEYTQNTVNNVTLYARWELTSSTLTTNVYTENADDANFTLSNSGISSITLEKFEDGEWVSADSDAEISYNTSLRYVIVTNNGFNVQNASFVDMTGELSSNGNTYTFEFTMPGVDTTVTINVYRNEYTLSFENANSSVVTTSAMPDEIELKFGASINLPAAVTATGYTFANWNTNPDGSGTVYPATSSYTQGAGDEILYSIWNINSHTITINVSGAPIDEVGFTLTDEDGTEILKSDDVNTTYLSDEIEYNTNLILTIESGIYNIGSVSGTSGEGAVRTFTMLDEDMEINIIFGEAPYVLTLNPNTSIITDYTVEWTESEIEDWTEAELSTITTTIYSNQTISSLPTPTIKGLQFVDWYTGPNGTGNAITSYTQTTGENVTLYAHYTLAGFDYTFIIQTEDAVDDVFNANLDGINGSVTLQTYDASSNTWINNASFTYGSPINLQYLTNARFVFTLNSGFEFTEENIVTNFNGVLSNSGNTYYYTFVMTNEPVTTTISILRTRFTLEFNKNTQDNVENLPEIVSLKMGASYIVPDASNMVRKGYAFTGNWNVYSSDGTVAATYNFGDTFVQSTAGITILYAEWSPKTYTIEFDLGAGTTSSETTIQVGYDSSIVMPDTENAGFILGGWTIKIKDTDVTYSVSTGDTLRTLETRNSADLVGTGATQTFVITAVWSAGSNIITVGSRLDETLYEQNNLTISSRPTAPTISLFVNGVPSTSYEAQTGQTVRLEATNVPTGYQVKEWIISGTATQTNPDGNLNSVEITGFTSNFNVTLVYEPKELTVTLADSTNGTLSFATENSGVYNISNNTATTLTGVNVNVVATPSTGYTFSSATSSPVVTISPTMQGDAANLLVVGIREDTEISAVFTERDNIVIVEGENISSIRYQISDTESFGDSFITYNVNGISIKTGQYLRLVVTTSQGYSVTAVVSTNGSVQIEYPYQENADQALITNITSDLTITVETTINEYTLTTGVVNNGTEGTVTVETTPNPSGKFNYNTSVTVSAASQQVDGLDKYNFVGWYTDLEGNNLYSTNNPLSFNITEDIALYAAFEIKTFTVSYQVGANFEAYGSITGETQQTINFGENAAEVTAVPGTGYTFSRWVITRGENVSYVTTPNLTIENVTENVTCVAEFNTIPVTINVQVSIEGEIITEGIDKVAIQYLSGAEGDNISTAELLEMTLNGQSNTPIQIRAIAKSGYTFGISQPYTVSGNIEVQVNGDVVTLIAREEETNVVINFARRSNVITSNLMISGVAGGGLIRYQTNSIWQHTGPSYEVSMPTETTLSYKIFITPGYQLEEEFRNTYVDAQTYVGNGYTLTITTATEYTGLDDQYFTEAYDVTISGYKTDIQVTIPVERLRTLVTFHNGNRADDSETFTAYILYGTTEIVGATRDQLVPTSETHTFVGWANSSNAVIINSSGQLSSTWLFTNTTYDLYAQWQEKLIQINVEVEPTAALQSETNFYTTLFANSAAYGLRPEAYETENGTIYYTRPLSRLYLTLPVYKSGYIFEGFYIMNPTSGEYEKVSAEGSGTSEDYATSTNCMINIQSFDYYTYSDILKNGSLNIKLVFNVTTQISARNQYGDNNRVADIGGSVRYVDATGVESTPGILDLVTSADATIKMIATADEGYTFVRWVDETGMQVSTNPEFQTTASQSKHYTAIFVGNRIQFTSDYENVTVEGGNSELSNDVLYYHYGDIVRFRYNGYVVGYDHVGWALTSGGEAITTLTGVNPSYTLETSYTTININPTFEMSTVNVTVIMSGGGEGNGTITFPGGFEVDYSKEGDTYTFTMPYETNLEFTIVPNIRYAFDNATIAYGDQEPAAVQVTGNNFRIEYSNYGNARNIVVNINYREIYWREYVLESGHIIDNGDGTYSVNPSGGDFFGNGTDDYPYELNNILDIAKLAFIINNNIRQSDRQKAEYSTAVYELSQDINFADRFWTPIGTRDNPFRGTFYLRGERLNLFVDDNDELFPANTCFDTEAEYYTLYGKLFGFLDGANIIVEEPSLLVLWIVLGVVLLLILIIVLVIIISNNRRKKLMQERQQLLR